MKKLCVSTNLKTGCLIAFSFSPPWFYRPFLQNQKRRKNNHSSQLTDKHTIIIFCIFYQIFLIRQSKIRGRCFKEHIEKFTMKLFQVLGNFSSQKMGIFILKKNYLCRWKWLKSKGTMIHENTVLIIPLEDLIHFHKVSSSMKSSKSTGLKNNVKFSRL